jgi:subtilisin family serine protease
MRGRILFVTTVALASALAVSAAWGSTGASPRTPSAALAWPTVQLALPAAWAATGDAEPVTIAVVDTGVSQVRGLQGAVAPGIDLVNGDGDARDDNGHGTMIASLAAGRASYGVCPSCTVLPVKVLDAGESGKSATVAAGVAWAVEHGAKVINVSLNAASERPDLNAALEAAVAAGVTVVVAAGNGGSADPAHGGYPGPSVPDAIRVAASAKTGRIAAWSNRGTWVDVAAPGWTPSVPRVGGGTIASSGTSFAAAYVSGVAALLLSKNPSLTPAQVKAAIVAGGTPSAGLPVASARLVNAAGALRQATKLALAAG